MREMMRSSIEQYIAFLYTKRRPPAMLKVVRQDLTHFVAWWEHTRRQTFDPTLLLHEDLRDWRLARQRDDGAAPAPINCGLASQRGYCQWATFSHLLTENPATDVKDVPTDPLAPRSLPTEAVDALLRVAWAEQHLLLRARHEALLARLTYVGLRVQEACDLQLRDLDLGGSTDPVRSGKAGKAYRVPLHPDPQRLLHRYLDVVRYPQGLPTIGSDRKRERLLVGIDMTAKGQPMRLGITQRVVQRLGQQLRIEAQRGQDIKQHEELYSFARHLEAATPHMLRHSWARCMLERWAQLPEVQTCAGASSALHYWYLPSSKRRRCAFGYWTRWNLSIVLIESTLRFYRE